MKKFLAVLLVLAMALSLAACTQEKAADADQPAKTADDVKTADDAKTDSEKKELFSWHFHFYLKLFWIPSRRSLRSCFSSAGFVF